MKIINSPSSKYCYYLPIKNVHLNEYLHIFRLKSGLFMKAKHIIKIDSSTYLEYFGYFSTNFFILSFF